MATAQIRKLILLGCTACAASAFMAGGPRLPQSAPRAVSSSTTLGNIRMINLFGNTGLRERDPSRCAWHA